MGSPLRRGLPGYAAPPEGLLEGGRDWEQARRDVEEGGRGLLIVGSGERLFAHLYFLKGFKNLTLDITPPTTPRVDRHAAGVRDETGEDIGDRRRHDEPHADYRRAERLDDKPAQFRGYPMSMFEELFATCRRTGTHVYLSSEGRLLDTIPDLVECIVSIHDLQMRANSSKGSRGPTRGGYASTLDLDREILPSAPPRIYMREHREIRDAVERLYPRRAA